MMTHRSASRTSIIMLRRVPMRQLGTVRVWPIQATGHGTNNAYTNRLAPRTAIHNEVHQPSRICFASMTGIETHGRDTIK
eukprot:5012360-Amphidinium_carterae.1